MFRQDVDVLVNCPGLDAREAIMKHNKDFAMHHPKLLYKSVRQGKRKLYLILTCATV